MIYLCFFLSCFVYLFFSFFFWSFWTATMAYGGSQARDRIGWTAAGLHHSHSNTRSKLHLWPPPKLTAMRDPLTHWTRPGIKPTSSLMLARFLYAEPWWEFLYCRLLIFVYHGVHICLLLSICFKQIVFMFKHILKY